MKETYEFRIYEEYAKEILSNSDGLKLGSGLVRLIRLDREDSRFDKIADLERTLKNQGGIFSAWNIERLYTYEEIATAELFHLKIKRTFGPAGEECGTIYDENVACLICGSGAKQVNDLHIEKESLPASQDIARTIAGEVIVSRKVKELFVEAGINGACFLPIYFGCRAAIRSNDWFQLAIRENVAEIGPKTRIGVDPFNPDNEGKYRCDAGDLVGLNLLSEVSILDPVPDKVDILGSRQFVGVRRGLLRPERIILVSSKLRKLIESEKLKGFGLEVAYFDPAADIR